MKTYVTPDLLIVILDGEDVLTGSATEFGSESIDTDPVDVIEQSFLDRFLTK